MTPIQKQLSDAHFNALARMARHRQAQDLFYTPYGLACRPLSHTNDPETSYNAADKMVNSGELNRQEQKVYSAIIEFIGFQPNTFGFTAKELPRYSGINYYTIQRRLSGLCNKGRIERTGEKRDGCCVWRLK